MEEQVVASMSVLYHTSNKSEFILFLHERDGTFFLVTFGTVDFINGFHFYQNDDALIIYFSTGRCPLADSHAGNTATRCR